MPERSAAAAGTGTQSFPAQSSGWGVAVTEPAPAVETVPDAVDAAISHPSPDPDPAASQWQPVETPPVREKQRAEVIAPAPIEEFEAVAPSGPVPDVVAENTINDMAENRVNIALFHIERLKQLVPDITGWSEQQASSVDAAITALETSLKGREEAGDPYQSLRETLKIARHAPRDIDLMIALADRAGEIEDLLSAHDQYSAGVREALFAIKPAAVNYVTQVSKRPARKQPARRAAAKKTAPGVVQDSTTNPEQDGSSAEESMAPETDGPASEQQE